MVSGTYRASSLHHSRALARDIHIHSCFLRLFLLVVRYKAQSKKKHDFLKIIMREAILVTYSKQDHIHVKTKGQPQVTEI